MSASHSWYSATSWKPVSHCLTVQRPELVRAGYDCCERGFSAYKYYEYKGWIVPVKYSLLSLHKE